MKQPAYLHGGASVFTDDHFRRRVNRFAERAWPITSLKESPHWGMGPGEWVLLHSGENRVHSPHQEDKMKEQVFEELSRILPELIGLALSLLWWTNCRLNRLVMAKKSKIMHSFVQFCVQHDDRCWSSFCSERSYGHASAPLSRWNPIHQTAQMQHLHDCSGYIPFLEVNMLLLWDISIALGKADSQNITFIQAIFYDSNVSTTWMWLDLHQS